MVVVVLVIVFEGFTVSDVSEICSTGDDGDGPVDGSRYGSAIMGRWIDSGRQSKRK